MEPLGISGPRTNGAGRHPDEVLVGRPVAAISWSGGKDSCAAYHRARADFDIVAAITMFNEDGTRSRSHGLRPEIVAAQVERLGLHAITGRCSWDHLRRGVRSRRSPRPRRSASRTSSSATSCSIEHRAVGRAACSRGRGLDSGRAALEAVHHRSLSRFSRARRPGAHRDRARERARRVVSRPRAGRGSARRSSSRAASIRAASAASITRSSPTARRVLAPAPRSRARTRDQQRLRR